MLVLQEQTMLPATWNARLWQNPISRGFHESRPSRRQLTARCWTGLYAIITLVSKIGVVFSNAHGGGGLPEELVSEVAMSGTSGVHLPHDAGSDELPIRVMALHALVRLLPFTSLLIRVTFGEPWGS